jgi:putative hydrolase of the HAD superfamily
MAAGINAVFVPHDNTWVLEHETVNVAPPGVQMLQLERFSDLKTHF